MAKMLADFADRDEAHQHLATVRGGEYPNAECREDPNAEKPYQVWSGDPRPEQHPVIPGLEPPPPPPPKV
jgi:hypothetical protein